MVIMKRKRLQNLDRFLDLPGDSATGDENLPQLAELIGADTLVIITQVEKVSRGYGTPEQQDLDVITAAEAKVMLDAGEFPAGSMGPKIESAVSFLASGGQSVVITSPEHILAALTGDRGTTIIPA